MSRRWFSRRGLELESEKIDFKTNTLADAKLNTHRILTDADLPIPGTVTGLTPIGAAPNGNAASIVGNNLNLQPASAAFGGVLTTGAQTLAGTKTFNNAIVTPGITNPTIDFTTTTLADAKLNTHRILTDVDMLDVDPIGAVPNASGASIVGNTLNLQPASAAFGGVMTTDAQTFAGAKTFNDPIVTPGITNPTIDFTTTRS